MDKEENGKIEVKGLTTPALEFWNFGFNPFTRNPLEFKKDQEIFVETSAIKLINQICGRFSADRSKKTILIEGNRGSGKTTALRHFDQCIKNLGSSKYLSILCEVNTLRDETYEEIEFTVNNQILISLLDYVNRHKELIPEELDFYKVFRVLKEENIMLTNEYIYLITNKIHEKFQKMVLIIDNLDKLNPKHYRNFETYFNRSQGFYEELNSTNGFFYVIFSMQNFLSAYLSRQVSYLGDERVTVSDWTRNELLELISKRIKYALKDGTKFSLTDFIEERVLDFLFGVNDYNPRFSIIATMKLFQKAYECNKKIEHQNICKPIKKEFLEKFSDIVVRKTGFSEYRDFRIIEQLAWERHKKALKFVGNTLRENKDFVYEIVTALLKIWQEEEFDENSAVIRKLDKNPIIKKELQHNRFTLKFEVRKLFEFLDQNFNHDIDSIRLFLITSFM